MREAYNMFKDGGDPEKVWTVYPTPMLLFWTIFEVCKVGHSS
jgi:hypothetical protein